MSTRDCKVQSGVLSSNHFCSWEERVKRKETSKGRKRIWHAICISRIVKRQRSCTRWQGVKRKIYQMPKWKEILGIFWLGPLTLQRSQWGMQRSRIWQRSYSKVVETPSLVPRFHSCPFVTQSAAPPSNARARSTSLQSDLSEQVWKAATDWTPHCTLSFALRLALTFYSWLEVIEDCYPGMISSSMQQTHTLFQQITRHHCLSPL